MVTASTAESELVEAGKNTPTNIHAWSAALRGEKATMSWRNSPPRKFPADRRGGQCGDVQGSGLRSGPDGAMDPPRHPAMIPTRPPRPNQRG